MNWSLLLQGIDTAGVVAILITIGGVYREHKIMWHWFESRMDIGGRQCNTVTPERRHTK